MATFLTADDDEGTPRGGMSEVDRQRLANADWKDKYEEAVRVHGLKERENEAQLAIAKRELTRQGERAVAAEAKLEAASAAADCAAAAHAEALSALRAECEADVQRAEAEAEARGAHGGCGFQGCRARAGAGGRLGPHFGARGQPARGGGREGDRAGGAR
jgi:membrane protein involved in colicin uptake